MSRIRNAVSGWRRLAVLLLLTAAIFPPAGHASSGSLEEEVREIGSRVELFVDDWLIGRLDHVRLALHRPQPAEVVMDFNRGVGKVTTLPTSPCFRTEIYSACTIAG